MAARDRPPAEDLRRFAEDHLLYEAGMLYEMTGKLMNRHHKDDQVVENGLLESFAIHSRNLLDFVWLDEPMKPTDAVAADYFPEGEWNPPEQSERLSKLKDRVGKEIVHLSYNRLTIPDDERGWQVLGIGPEILGGFSLFASKVPSELVPEGWRDRAYAATGTVPPEKAQEVAAQVIEAHSIPTQGLPPPDGSPHL
jgi:hypothetical protein